MNLIALPAFSDNCIWMLHDGHRAVVVDPGESAPVIKALDSHKLQLAAILVTHHHADHVGGFDELRTRLQGPVRGPRRERIRQPFVALEDGDKVDVPGHTSGHIAYFSEDGGAEPKNHGLADPTTWCEAQRALGAPTLPSSIATERLVNPFLRCAEAGVALVAQTRDAQTTDPVAVLAALRQWKNEFR